MKEIAKKEKRLKVLGADVLARIGCQELKDKNPGYVLDMGISEQNMIGVAAALANEGNIVFAVSYAPFITSRVLDQIRVFLSIMECPVCLIGFSAGLGGSDLGPTHTSFEDIGVLRSLPNIDIVCPSSTAMTVDVLLDFAKNPRPMYCRLTDVVNLDFETHMNQSNVNPLVSGGLETIVLSNGTMAEHVIDSVNRLKDDGMSISAFDIPYIKPLSSGLLDLLRQAKRIITVEEHNIEGGFGTIVRDYASDNKLQIPITKIGVSNYFYPDRRSSLLKFAKLDSDSLYARIKEIVL